MPAEVFVSRLFGGDCLFATPRADPKSLSFRLSFPAAKAIYDGLETDGIAQASDFQTVTETNFRDIDAADYTLSPSMKLPILVARAEG